MRQVLNELSGEHSRIDIDEIRTAEHSAGAAAHMKSIQRVCTLVWCQHVVWCWMLRFERLLNGIVLPPSGDCCGSDTKTYAVGGWAWAWWLISDTQRWQQSINIKPVCVPLKGLLVAPEMLLSQQALIWIKRLTAAEFSPINVLCYRCKQVPLRLLQIELYLNELYFSNITN